MTIYIVWGTTGEYEDVIQWNVKAFVNLDSAKEFKKTLETCVEGWKGWDWPTCRDFRHPLDPGLKGIWEVLKYDIEELELKQ